MVGPTGCLPCLIQLVRCRSEGRPDEYRPNNHCNPGRPLHGILLSGFQRRSIAFRGIRREATRIKAVAVRLCDRSSPSAATRIVVRSLNELSCEVACIDTVNLSLHKPNLGEQKPYFLKSFRASAVRLSTRPSESSPRFASLAPLAKAGKTDESLRGRCECYSPHPIFSV
jgi:hypothetical protein